MFGDYLIKMLERGAKQTERAESFVDSVLSSYTNIFNAERINPYATSKISGYEMIEVLIVAMKDDKDFVP